MRLYRIALIAAALLVAGLIPGQRAHAAELNHVCSIAYVASRTNRVGLKCETATASGIKYFAVGTTSSNSEFANRTLSILTASKIAGRQVRVYYESSASQNPQGCQSNDCRRIKGVTMN